MLPVELKDVTSLANMIGRVGRSSAINAQSFCSARVRFWFRVGLCFQRGAPAGGASGKRRKVMVESMVFQQSFSKRLNYREAISSQQKVIDSQRGTFTFE